MAQIWKKAGGEDSLSLHAIKAEIRSAVTILPQVTVDEGSEEHSLYDSTEVKNDVIRWGLERSLAAIEKAVLKLVHKIHCLSRTRC